MIYFKTFLVGTKFEYSSYSKDEEGMIPHREDGPAQIWVDGYKTYWLDGVRFSEEEYWNQLDYKKRFGGFV